MSITADTLRQARTMRVIVDSTVDATTRDLVRAWSGAWHEIADEWSAALVLAKRRAQVRRRLIGGSGPRSALRSGVGDQKDMS